ncbi:enoyl-CoA hydratase [Herbaspirillum sp. meg3]|uniref:enoyl-CoA hydratase-related protein n=1 Tax=Herbaspirillum sp. meg3 TaxID=2025949 RepID=UPI000B98860D|nr:enoyl-CoA hydratase-related protein [Herbaspirillum sp. meg3]ASU38341.1 enoyl-CoA hydratase [Herbaspirillum sp. meg3]
MTAELKASRHDATLVLTFANPGQQNAFDGSVLAAAIETLSKAERDDSVRAIVLTGADQCFCSGVEAGKDLETQVVVLENLQNLIETIRSFPKPIIAAVEGVAIDAGFSLALASDLIVAGQNASFGISPAQIGTWAVGGASWFLPQRLPQQWIAEILLDAKPLGAARLHAAGLVNKLSADGTALDKALAWAEQLSASLASAPAAFEQFKTLLGNASSTTLSESFSSERHRLLTKRPGTT